MTFANGLHASCKLMPFFDLFPCQMISLLFLHPIADFWPMRGRIPGVEKAFREQPVDGRHGDSSPCGKLRGREGFALPQSSHRLEAPFLRRPAPLPYELGTPFTLFSQFAEEGVDASRSEAGPMVLGGASESGENTLLNPFAKETGTDTEEASHGGKWPDASRFRAQGTFDTRAPLQNSPYGRRVPQKVEKSQTSPILR